eukprot:Em0022g993a
MVQTLSMDDSLSNQTKVEFVYVVEKQEWVDHFESVAVVNKWDTDGDKLKWLTVRLTGKAHTVFMKLPENTRKDYGECIEKPQVAFGVKQKRPQNVEEAVTATIELESYLRRSGPITASACTPTQSKRIKNQLWIPHAHREEVRKLLQDMLAKLAIQPSDSPWSSPIVLVTKTDGSTRFCMDYRKVNTVTSKDAYPLPRVDDPFGTLAGSKLFSTLDLATGYWQVEVADEVKEKAAFLTPEGLYQFEVMPFELCNALATFPTSYG